MLSLRWLGWFLGRLLRRSAVGIAVGLIALALPLPPALDLGWHLARAGLGALIFVCALGKALYDTLFFDHYRP